MAARMCAHTHLVYTQGHAGLCMGLDYYVVDPLWLPFTCTEHSSTYVCPSVTHIHTYTHKYSHTHKNTHKQRHIQTLKHTHKHTLTHTLSHTHTHTHTHTQTHTHHHWGEEQWHLYTAALPPPSSTPTTTTTTTTASLCALNITLATLPYQHLSNTTLATTLATLP